MICNSCGADRWGVGPSCFPGWDLFSCLECGRPVKLIAQNGPRVRLASGGRRERSRALRAARRNSVANSMTG